MLTTYYEKGRRKRKSIHEIQNQNHLRHRTISEMPVPSWLTPTKSIEQKAVWQRRNFAQSCPQIHSCLYRVSTNRETLNREEATSLLVSRHIFISSFLPEEALKKPLKVDQNRQPCFLSQGTQKTFTDAVQQKSNKDSDRKTIESSSDNTRRVFSKG